ncbi:MAG: hypothetical protein M3Y86_00315 [Verrucomicrobiota bacterium]|nr:hypothetical protein [Verrucomicrobiota bacterium]
MKRALAMRLFFGALALACASAFADERGAWTQANQEYSAGHYREALDLYGKVRDAGATSAALFYNIGNTQYRLGALGPAILNYERALMLEPHHPEAEANLRLVRDKARALELRRNSFAEIVARATPAQYSIAAAIAFWIAVFAMVSLLIARKKSGAFVAAAVLGGLVFASAVVALYFLETGVDGRGLAIVTANKIEARLATADNAATVLVLPPGSEVKILSTRGDWTYAALPNEQRGWIPASSAERVRVPSRAE